MSNTYGLVRVFGNGLWRVRNFGKTKSLRIQMRHKGAVHDAVTDIMLEKRKSRNNDWTKLIFTNSIQNKNNSERDDLKVFCGVLSEQQMYYHTLVCHVNLGLPLTKSRYAKWSNECTEKNLFFRRDA